MRARARGATRRMKAQTTAFPCPVIIGEATANDAKYVKQTCAFLAQKSDTHLGAFTITR